MTIFNAWMSGACFIIGLAYVAEGPLWNGLWLVCISACQLYLAIKSGARP